MNRKDNNQTFYTANFIFASIFTLPGTVVYCTECFFVGRLSSSKWNIIQIDVTRIFRSISFEQSFLVILDVDVP